MLQIVQLRFAVEPVAVAFAAAHFDFVLDPDRYGHAEHQHDIRCAAAQELLVERHVFLT